MKPTSRIISTVGISLALLFACAGRSETAQGADTDPADTDPADTDPADTDPADATAAANAESTPLPSAVETSTPADCASPPPALANMNGSLDEFFARECDVERCTSPRFDDCVRDVAFAAYAGDADALDRTWCLLDATLAATPDHAEALVWRGGLKLFLSGFAYNAGDFAEGAAVQQQGFDDLDRGLRLAPDNIGVRIQHMSSLVEVLPYVSGARRMELVDAAQEDLDFRWSTLENQTVPLHSRGELWAVDVNLQHYRSLETAEAERSATLSRLNEMLSSMQSELAGSAYARAAECWSDGKTTAQIACLGCHVAE